MVDPSRRRGADSQLEARKWNLSVVPVSRRPQHVDGVIDRDPVRIVARQGNRDSATGPVDDPDIVSPGWKDAHGRDWTVPAPSNMPESIERCELCGRVPDDCLASSGSDRGRAHRSGARNEVDSSLFAGVHPTG